MSPPSTPTTPCLQLHGSIDVHELTLSAVCQLRQMNQTTFAGQRPPPPTPALSRPRPLSVTRRSLRPLPSSSVLSSLSFLSHYALSGCQSETGFVTGSESCTCEAHLRFVLAPSCVCVCMVKVLVLENMQACAGAHTVSVFVWMSAVVCDSALAYV